jgi:hypothetical protein
MAYNRLPGRSHVLAVFNLKLICLFITIFVISICNNLIFPLILVGQKGNSYLYFEDER